MWLRELYVPEVVVEVVRAGFVGFVGEDNAGTTVVLLTGGVHDEVFLDCAVRHDGLVAWGCVAVGIGD